VDETVSNSSKKCSLARYCPASLKGALNQAVTRARRSPPAPYPGRRARAVRRSPRQTFRRRSDFRRPPRPLMRAPVHTRSHSAHASPAPAWMRRRSRAVAPDGL